jgi:uncharacterized protein
MDERELESMRAVAGEMLGGASFAGMDHIERVLTTAEKIGRQEGTDLDVLRAAAYLHDIAVPLNKARHYALGARLARGLLGETSAGQEETEAIVHAIEAHSRYGGPDPQTLEARVLYDADTVEFVGAIGLARGIVRAMESGEYSGDVRQLPALVDHMIAQVEGLQHTKQGKAMADGRIVWLLEYKARLEAELRGDL